MTKKTRQVSTGQCALSILADLEAQVQPSNIRISRNTRKPKAVKQKDEVNNLTLLDINDLTTGPITSPKPSIVATTSHAIKLEIQHQSFRRDRLPLDDLEPKAREYYRYLLVNYGYFVAENYVNLVATEDYKNRPPILKDSFEDSWEDEED